MAIFYKLLVRNCLSPFNGGSHIASDCHGIVIWFPQIDVNAPTVFILSYVDSRTCIVEALELKHKMHLFEKSFGTWRMRLFMRTGYKSNP